MNGAEIRMYNFEKICRLCLHEKKNLIKIFESSIGDNSMLLQQKIMACAAINLHSNDGLPSKICFKCLSNLNSAFEFKIQCEKADKKLQDIKTFILSKTDTERYFSIGSCNELVHQKEEKFSNKISPQKLNQVIFIKKQKTSNLAQKVTKSFMLDVNDKSNKEKLKSATFTDSNIYNASRILNSRNSENFESFHQNQKKSDKIENKNSVLIQDINKANCKVANDLCDKRKVFKMNELKLKSKESFGLDRRKAPCPFCNKMLMRMDEHIRLLHRNRVYICTKQGCGAEFSTLKNLQSHQLRCYNIKKAYKCYKCAKEFHRNSNFKAHIRRHSNKKDFQCQLCDKAFVDSTGLRRHFLKHHEPEQQIFVSGCCGKQFKSKEGLKKHISKSICGLHVFQLVDSGFLTNLTHETKI